MYRFVGALLPFTVTVKDADGNPAAPGAITLTVTRPDGTTDTPTPQTPSLGVYQVDYPTATPGAGRYVGYWQSTGANASAWTQTFQVEPANAGFIVNLEDVKDYLNIPAITATYDNELHRYMGAATRRIERHTGKVTARRNDATVTTVSYASEIWLRHHPILSLTSIATIDGLTTWPVTSGVVYVEGEVGRIRRLTGSYWTGDLVINYSAGMRAIPDDYTDTALEMVRRRWNSQRQPGVGPSPFGGGESPGPTTVSTAWLTEMLGPPGVMVA